MSTQRCVLGSLVGGIVLFFVGYLLFGVLLAGFFEANVGTATGVNREPIAFVVLALGQLAWGGLLAQLIVWTGASTPAAGARVGATAGVLAFLGFDLTLYATTNLSNLTGALADAAVATLLFALTGAIVALVVGKKGAA